MKKSFSHLIVFVFSMAGLSLAQENYANWKYQGYVTVTTTSAGANVAVTQTNFPLLVRLNSSNLNFAHARRNGEDVRFTDLLGTTRYKHQIESWDSAGHSAAVWVLVPSIVGNGTTSLRIYLGNSTAADSSNGAAVFSTANNFQGVFHLSEATNDTVRDATSNLFKGVPRNKGGVNPTDTIGAIGQAKNFLGSGLDSNGGSYRILTSTGGNTFTNNALNFQNDSSTAGGNGLPQYTISAWIYVSEFPSGPLNTKGIISKSAGTTSTTQYLLRLLDPATDNVCAPVCDTNRLGFFDPVPAVYKSGVNPLSVGNWYHVAAVRNNGAPGNSPRLRVWINGYAPPPGITIPETPATTRQDLNVYIGGFSNDSGFFNGKIDEVEFSSTARDSNWLKLSYETQKPGANAVSVSYGDPAPPAVSGLTYVTNPLNLVAGVAMARDSAIVTNAVSFSISPALPTGLTLNAITGAISGTPTANVAVPTTSYTVTASGGGGSASAVALSITVLAPPFITSQPANIQRNPGPAVVKFGIKATGSATLTYKWVRTRGVVADTLYNGGTAPAALFSGLTTDTLTITNPPWEDNGTTYKCVVRNSVGIAVSNAGTLTIYRPIDGIWDPQIIHVTGKNPFSFRIPPTNGISNIRMTIENMSGRAVWSKDFNLDASRDVSWNGKGADGRPVSSGMYVVKMKLLDADNKSVGEAAQTGIKAR